MIQTKPFTIALWTVFLFEPTAKAELSVRAYNLKCRFPLLFAVKNGVLFLKAYFFSKIHFHMSWIFKGNAVRIQRIPNPFDVFRIGDMIEHIQIRITYLAFGYLRWVCKKESVI